MIARGLVLGPLLLTAIIQLIPAAPTNVQVLFRLPQGGGEPSTTLCADGVAAGSIRYIRAGAAGADTGLDWTNAHTVLPGSLTRGRTYCIADGTYAGYTFNDAVSGTQLITIAKATVADHGTSTGWLDSYGDGQAVWSAGLTITTSYWLISGQVRTDLENGYGFFVDDTDVPLTQAHGLEVASATASNITVRFTHLAGPAVECQASGDDSTGYYDIQGSDLVTLDRIKIEGHLVPMRIGNTNNLKLTRSVIAENLSNAACHSEHIAMSNDDNMVIEYNLFRDIQGTGGIVCLSRGGVSDCANVKIYGNVFWRTTSEGMGNGIIDCINLMVCSDWVIYNNAFVELSPGTSARIDFGNAGVGSTLLNRNNIWQVGPNVGHSCNAGSTCTHSHNVYTDTTGENGSETSVQVVDSTNWFTDTTGADFTQVNFHLATATNAGFSLPSPYNIDADGETRGSDGTWDRGAFERVTGGDDNDLFLALFHRPAWTR